MGEESLSVRRCPIQQPDRGVVAAAPPGSLLQPVMRLSMEYQQVHKETDVYNMHIHTTSHTS